MSDDMTKEKKHQREMDWYMQSQKNWRAWGSWFSWGSPVGLGLFFIEMAAAAWIISQMF